MKNTLETRLRESRRLMILQLINALEARRIDTGTLAYALRDLDMEMPADVLDGELSWLERQGLVSIDRLPIGKSVAITARGDQHARGVTVEPGVARPALGWTMARPSSVKKLPSEVRTNLEAWLKAFIAGELSLDQVMERLDGIAALHGLEPVAIPSRSAVHRYAQKFEAVVERIQRAKELTNLLAEQLGPEVADGRGVQVMVQAVQSLTYDLLASLEEGTAVDPKAIHDLAKAAHHLAAAQKTDADRALKIEQEVRKKAAASAGAEAKAMGLTEDKVRQIEKAVLGVDRG